MEQTPRGLALAAATRETIRKKRSLLRSSAEEPSAKKRNLQVRKHHPCQHEVAIPKDYEIPQLDSKVYGTIYEPKFDGTMAKKYPFQLDDFQSLSVACIERKESVLVAAHTSAGKTAVAEYAIAKALGSHQRCVYTSPLKALSNQKYRELSEEFLDVGLMTGDVSLNPNASCVVMTTEILRSMMYRGSELLREVSWIIFDEIHYMQDRERGVVWEEVIIFMPKDVRMVFLSATLPNSLEFAEWVTSVHGAPCHVVSTDYRPTPLVHYGFPMGGRGLYLLLDYKGRFHSDNFEALKSNFASGDDADKEDISDGKKSGKHEKEEERRRGGRGTKERGRGGDRKKAMKGSKKKANVALDRELERLIGLIKGRKMDPVIVFSFSRRECEAYARALAAPGKPNASGVASRSLDFNSSEEKQQVAEIFDSALECLREEDRDLPMVKMMRPVLMRGIGMHHSGLLPILKELVEILFQEQLIKCLFATETFAMGLNMPAKTVIFTQLSKWDGEERRFLTSAEYIQMSGRAGRRGQDDRGFALLLADDSLDEETCRTMLSGGAAPLLSSFKLTYYTLLNLMRRVEGTGADMEYVISKSFSQFQHQKRLPEMNAQLSLIRTEAQKLSTVREEDARGYITLKKQLQAARASISKRMMQPDSCIHFLRAGRIVSVANGGIEWGYGVVVSVQRISKDAAPSSPESYIVDTLLCCDPSKTAVGDPAPMPLWDSKTSMCVIPVSLPLITGLSSLRIAIPTDLKEERERLKVLQTVREASKRYPKGELPELGPEDLGIKDEVVQKAVQTEQSAKEKLNELESRILAEVGKTDANGAEKSAAQGRSGVDGRLLETGDLKVEDLLRKKARLLSQADAIERQTRMNQVTKFQEEAKARTAVLRKLGHVSNDGVVTLKGRAASEVDTGDELLASELMFNGTFNSLDPYQLASLVSCLVPIEESKGEIKVQSVLSDPLRQLQDTARNIAEVSTECKLDVDVDAYVESFRPTLMEVVYEWSLGKTFKEVMDLTDVFEGSVIRAMRRLDELMQNLERAAGVVGDAKLAELFEKSRGSIKRDLPFAASLYV